MCCKVGLQNRFMNPYSLPRGLSGALEMLGYQQVRFKESKYKRILVVCPGLYGALAYHHIWHINKQVWFKESKYIDKTVFFIQIRSTVTYMNISHTEIFVKFCLSSGAPVIGNSDHGNVQIFRVPRYYFQRTSVSEKQALINQQIHAFVATRDLTRQLFA